MELILWSVFSLLSVHESSAQLVNQYVDFLPGNLNVILSSPHGGDLDPGSLPDRDAGCWDGSVCTWSHDCGSKDFDNCDAVTANDAFTQELTRELRDALCTEFGDCPPTVINRLHRTKHDANREVNEATFGVPEVVEAWNVYHGLLAEAQSNQTGPALVLDIHGHGHPNVWAELGYLISGSDLDSGNFVASDTSISHLSTITTASFEELLRGATSFGSMLESQGFECVPSPTNNGPNGESYFSGGYITQQYGSRDGGTVDAIQIESPREWREFERPAYVAAITATVRQYFTTHHP